MTWRFWVCSKALLVAIALLFAPPAKAQTLCGAANLSASFCSMPGNGGGSITPSFQGPGDVVSGALGWWGLRAYNIAYANAGGNAAIICDTATGLTCTTIKVLSNGNFDVATAQASASCATQCSVKTLYDQTGNGKNLSAPVLANEPILTFNCIGSLPCMTFNGSSSKLNSVVGSGYSQTAPYSMSGVSQLTTVQKSIILSSDHPAGGSGSYLYYDVLNAAPVNDTFSGNVVASNNTNANLPHASQGVVNSTTVTIYTDGVSTTSATGTPNPLAATDTIYFGSDPFADSFAGTIEEAGFWPTGFSNTQALAMDNNQRTYWQALPVTGNFYISAAGSNANNGTSSATPWLDFTNVNLKNFGNPSTINLRGGDTFTGCLQFTAGTNASSNLTIQTYNGGVAQITANCANAKSAAIAVNGVSNFTLNGVNLRGNSGSTQYGVLLTNSGAVAATNMTVQNADIAGFYTTSTTDYGGEIFVQGYPGTGGMNGINIIGNTLHGLSGTSSPDDNGISGFGNGEDIRNIHYASNVISNIGGKANGINGTEGNGILVNGINGVAISSNIVEKNVIHDMGGNTNTCGGPAGAWSFSSNNVTFQYNEVYNMQPIAFSAGCDWDAYDADGNSTNILFQYNYSHNNRGPGNLNFCSGTWGPITWQYNISENDDFGTTDDTAGNFFWQAQGCSTGVVNVYNNTYYNSIRSSSVRPVTFAIQSGAPSGGNIENNIFAVNADSFSNTFFINTEGQNPSSLTFKNNAFFAISAGSFLIKHPNCASGLCTSLAQWQAVVTGGDASATTANPTWVTPVGGNVACNVTTGAQTCPAGYKLNTGSTYKNTGIATQGSTDFFLSTIPTGTGTGYPIGASN